MCDAGETCLASQAESFFLGDYSKAGAAHTFRATMTTGCFFLSI